jgi:hypothetical protein
MTPRASKKELIALYLRFRSLLDGLKDLPDAAAMTPELDTLLAVIGTAWQADKPLAVRKLLIREELGSPATIHKRIHQLKDAGFVSFDTLTSSETKTQSPNKTPQPPNDALSGIYLCVANRRSEFSYLVVQTA